MPDRLTDPQVTEALRALPGWTREGDSIVREFRQPDFVAALGFIAQVGVLAERANHHPTIDNTYNRVRIVLSTHDAGGITEKDIALAKEIGERA